MIDIKQETERKVFVDALAWARSNQADRITLVQQALSYPVQYGVLSVDGQHDEERTYPTITVRVRKTDVSFATKIQYAMLGVLSDVSKP